MLAGSFWEFVFQMPQLAIIMGCLIPIIAIIASFWYKAVKVRAENDLKRSMVDRGMSPDEIERIIAAQTSDHCGS